jgi:hypothetical protein
MCVCVCVWHLVHRCTPTYPQAWRPPSLASATHTSRQVMNTLWVELAKNVLYTKCLVTSLPKIMYIHHTLYVCGSANPNYELYGTDSCNCVHASAYTCIHKCIHMHTQVTEGKLVRRTCACSDYHYSCVLCLCCSYWDGVNALCVNVSIILQLCAPVVFLQRVHLLFSCNVCTYCFLAMCAPVFILYLATCAPVAFLQCVHLFLSCILQRVHLLLSCNVCCLQWLRSVSEKNEVSLSNKLFLNFLLLLARFCIVLVKRKYMVFMERTVFT